MLAIANARVFDGERVLPRATVVIDGDAITAVGADLELPAGTEIVDGTGHTVMPGLIDAHVHVFEAAQLERALAFGVTTVLDMGTWPERALRLKIEDRADRAELRSAGYVATAPGGHGTQYGRRVPTLAGPDEAAAFVDARLAEASDYLKIIYDDGSAYGRSVPALDRATLRALIDAAHAREVLAVVHIGDHDEARTAIECGADGVAHLFRDRAPAPDFGALLARERAFAITTLAVLRTPADPPHRLADDPDLARYLDPGARASLAAEFAFYPTCAPGVVEATLAQLSAAGVPILCGTDAPNPGTADGASMHDELALLVAAGLSPLEALAAATARPAYEFSLVDRGVIAPGRRADLVLVAGDPTTTITDTRRITPVWRAGVELDRAAYRDRIPAPAGDTFRCGCRSG